jgi:hypothetical protein
LARAGAAAPDLRPHEGQWDNGCKDPDKLHALRDLLASDMQLPAGWQKNLTAEDCHPVAADLRFHVVRRFDDLVLLQLAHDSIPPERSPVLLFAIADLVTMDGQAFRTRR